MATGARLGYNTTMSVSGNVEKNSETGRQKRLRNLRPRQKGAPPTPGAGRPKGSRNLKSILKEYLRAKYKPGTTADSLGHLTVQEAVVAMQVQRAVRHGGRDLEMIWTQEEEAKGAADAGADGYTPDDLRALMAIEIRRARRLNGKA